MTKRTGVTLLIGEHPQSWHSQQSRSQQRASEGAEAEACRPSHTPLHVNLSLISHIQLSLSLTATCLITGRLLHMQTNRPLGMLQPCVTCQMVILSILSLQHGPLTRSNLFSLHRSQC